MKKSAILTKGSFKLIRTEESYLKCFDSAIELDRFVELFDPRGYEIIDYFGSTAALIFRFFVIDTASTGFVLNAKESLTLEHCLNLIEHYL